MPLLLGLVDRRKGATGRVANLVLDHSCQDLLGLVFIKDLLLRSGTVVHVGAVIKLPQGTQQNLKLARVCFVSGPGPVGVVIIDAFHVHRCMGLGRGLSLGLPVQVSLMDADPFLDRLRGELALRIVQQQFHLVAAQLQGHHQKKPEILRGQSHAVFSEAPDLIIPAGEKHLMTFTLRPPKGISNFHKSVQHVFPSIFAVQLLGVHLV